MIFINYPKYVPISDYHAAIQRLVGKVARFKNVEAIYQFGTIKSPGISDIDLVAIFKDGHESRFNFWKDLSSKERYLFSHNIFGASIDHFSRSQVYNFWVRPQLVWGKQVPSPATSAILVPPKDLTVQVALEFLIDSYIDLTVQLTYGIVKVRSLIQRVKNLVDDLELLNVCSGRLFDMIVTLNCWASRWFEGRPDEERLTAWVRDFHQELYTFLLLQLEEYDFYLPECKKHQMTTSISITPFERLTAVHHGLVLPKSIGKLGKRYFNLQHRLNRFNFFVPMKSDSNFGIQGRRFLFFKEMKDYNLRYLRFYTPLVTTNLVYHLS